jgi:AcrR family transcriptional regulator
VLNVSPRAGLDRAQVVEAAGQIVDAGGLDALTLAALAERLGVRTPSLYNHVAGLPGLHRELALVALRRLSASLARAGIGKTTDEALEALAGAFRSFIKEHPGLYALTVQPAAPNAPPDLELVHASDEVVEIVLAVLASYGLRGLEAVHAVRGLRSVIHGFATLELAGGFGLPLDVDESYRLLIQIFIAGLRGPSLGNPQQVRNSSQVVR